MTSSLIWLVFSLVLISLLGVAINAYIFVVVLFSRQTSSANNLLLLHLGALEFLLGLTFLVFSAPGLTKSTWLSTGALCNVHGFLFTLLHPLVLWTICGLNADRYFAIATPLHYDQLVNRKKVLTCLEIGWLLSLALSIPPFFSVAPFKFNLVLGACIPDFDSEKVTFWYTATYTALTLLLPLTLIICCNAKVLMIARYRRHRTASVIYEIAISAVTILHQRNPFVVPTISAPAPGGPKFRSRSPVSSVLQLLGSALLLYLPYYGVILWESSMNFLLKTRPLPLDPLIYYVVLCMLTISPLVNGFLYGLKNKMLRKAFQNYWRKELTKNKVNHEMQARMPSTCGLRRQSLTPLGFSTRKTVPKRLSEAQVDIHRSSNCPSRPLMKRMASEIGWLSISSENFPPCNELANIPQTKSCNTLQVPKTGINDVKVEENIGSKSPTRNLNSANLLLQKFFGLDDRNPEVEADEVQRTELQGANLKTKLLDRNSDSSETSETSSCNILGTKELTNAANFMEEQALLSWPAKDDSEDILPNRFDGPSREIML